MILCKFQSFVALLLSWLAYKTIYAENSVPFFFNYLSILTFIIYYNITHCRYQRLSLIIQYEKSRCVLSDQIFTYLEKNEIIDMCVHLSNCLCSVIINLFY